MWKRRVLRFTAAHELPDPGTQAGDRLEVRRQRDRYRVREGADRPSHSPDQRFDRAPARAQEGPSLAPRPADARRPAPPISQLPPAPRPRGLPGPRARARPAQVSTGALVAPGTPAPEFSLKRQDGRAFT